jgi:pimeloyl-ACP methyl ester carboxylesterase
VLDRTAARFIGDRMGRSTHRDGAAVRDLRDAGARLRELAAAYGDGTAACPGLFFPAPARPSVTETVVYKGLSGLEPGAVVVSDLSFASEYVPFLPAAREWYPRYLANNTVHARLWRKPVAAGAAPRPVMILIHGWGAGEYWMIEQPFETNYWLHHGFDVCAFVLPFHGARTPDLAGEIATRPRQGLAALGKLAQSPLFPSPNIARTNEAFGQAVYDVRALAAYLRHRSGVGDALPIGVMGMSLGGYTAALWASVADDLNFAVAVIPAVSMSELMWSHGSGTAVRKRARDNGVDQDLLEQAFVVHSPLARPPRLSADRLFVIAGRGDRITPPDQAVALAAHWGCDVTWFEGGHLAQVGRHQAFSHVRKQLAAVHVPGVEV